MDWGKDWSNRLPVRRPRATDSEATIIERRLAPGDFRRAPLRPLADPIPAQDFVGLPAHELIAAAEKATARWKVEQGPSAVATAPERQRDTFSDLCDVWDLLPDAGR